MKKVLHLLDKHTRVGCLSVVGGGCWERERNELASIQRVARNTDRLSVQGTVVLEKTLESPLDCKEIQPVHPKGYQS